MRRSVEIAGKQYVNIKFIFSILPNLNCAYKMDIFLCIIKTIIGYFILIFVGTNLLGMVVRGFLPTYKKDSEGNLNPIVDTSSTSSITMTIVSILIGISYLFALYYYWNIGILIAGLILMYARLPDLLFEMRTGEKLTLSNMPKRPVDILFNILSWLTLPLIWYSLCYL